MLLRYNYIDIECYLSAKAAVASYAPLFIYLIFGCAPDIPRKRGKGTVDKVVCNGIY